MTMKVEFLFIKVIDERRAINDFGSSLFVLPVERSVHQKWARQEATGDFVLPQTALHYTKYIP